MKIVHIDTAQEQRYSLDARFIKVSTVLAVLEFKRYFNSICLYSERVGIDFLTARLKLQYDAVTDISDYSWLVNNPLFKKLLIASQQNQAFAVINYNCFVGHNSISSKLHNDVVITSYDFDHAVNYIHTCDIIRAIPGEELLDCDKDYIGYDLTIFGGVNFSFWRDYYEFVKNFISGRLAYTTNLTEENLTFLLSTYLFKRFCNKKEIQVSYLLEYPSRWPHLKSIWQLRQYMQSVPVFCIPKYMESRPEVYDLVAYILASSHPIYYSILKESEGALCSRDALSTDTFFRISSKILTNFFDAKLSDQISVEDLKGYIAKYSKDYKARLETKLLRDVFHFENEVYCYVTEPLSLSAGASPPVVITDSLCVQMSPLIKLIASRWDWRLGVEYIKLAELKILYNAKVPPKIHYTLLRHDKALQKTHQYRIDKGTAIICKIFSNAKTVSQGVAALLKTVRGIDDEAESQIKSIEAKCKDRIFELLNQGILLDRTY